MADNILQYSCRITDDSTTKLYTETAPKDAVIGANEISQGLKSAASEALQQPNTMRIMHSMVLMDAFMLVVHDVV